MIVRILAVVAVLAALGAATWYFWPRTPPPPPPAAQAPAVPAPAAPQGPRHPVETPVPDKPLPPLAQSDPAINEALGRLVGAGPFAKFFNAEGVVRNIVATVDNLPREAYAQRLNPVKPIEGPFRTTGQEQTLAIAPANALRYSAFIKLVEGVDSNEAVQTYRRFYPLFQQAYVELGYPDGYFNDRLVQVIDHLLAAPEIEGPIALTTPHVMHEYASAELEERSSGQKAMIRIGRDNARRLKAKLNEIRPLLVASAPSR